MGIVKSGIRMVDHLHPKGAVWEDWHSKIDGRVLYAAECGSHAYGFATEASDSDRFGFYAAPTSKVLSVRGLGTKGDKTTDFKDDHGDVVLHEVGKFMHLAMQGNPSVLNMLWMDNYYASQPGELIRLARQGFLWKGSLSPFLGYADSQLKKHKKGSYLHTKGGKVNGKWVCHLMRLLWQGLHIARTGDNIIDFGDERIEALRNLRKGIELERAIEDAASLASILRGFIDGESKTPLPEKPNYEAADYMLLNIRMAPIR